MPAVEISFNIMQPFLDAKEVLQEAFDTITEKFTEACKYIYKAIKFVLKGLWNKVILPVGVTGLNVMGYLVDKLLLGPPGFRQALANGLFPSDIPPSYREWVRSNSGWDIYTTLEGPVDNVIGFILGMGAGLANYLSHVLASIGHNIKNYHNLLGSVGVFGARSENTDNRNLAVRVVFGILSTPLVLPVLIITNISDIVFSTFKHLGLSIGHNVGRTYNLLGQHGVMGERQEYTDNRPLAARIFFGIFSFPVVAVFSSVTNLVDAVSTLIKHSVLSIYHNIKPNLNLLSTLGVFGQRREYQDDRHKAVKGVFGLLTAPITIPVIIITNLVDATLTFIKHFSLSMSHNIRASYNLLGEQGVLGERKEYTDERQLVVKIIFGILSFPVVAPISLLTNLVDALATTLKHFALSVNRNIKPTFNLLGTHGVFGARAEYLDDRHMAIKIIFGIMSFPVVAPIAMVTNLIDVIGATIKNGVLSICRNIKPTFNLLGQHGILGERQVYTDDRHLAVRIIFGALTSPIVATISMVTNLVDLIGTTFKHLALSVSRNIKPTFNLLGHYGVFGDKRVYQDDRHIAARVFFGFLTAPVVLPVVALTNLADAAFTFIKHSGLSIGRNIRSTYNLLGQHGVMGDRKEFADARHLAVKIIFGVLTFPVVAPVSIMTNLVDSFATSIKHFMLSVFRNIRFTANLLGNHGVFGDKAAYQDDRHPVIKAVFGILSLPVVLPVITITNLADGFLTTMKHLGLSIGHNISSSFNLLGQHGVMGGHRPYTDNRHLAVKIIFGVLTFPVVAVASTIINLVDILGAALKHGALSIGRNIKPTFNLLSTNGVFGPRAPYQDDRHPIAKVIFGIITAPLVLPVIAFTNIVDATLTFIKHLGLSVRHNIRRTYNLLGDNGVLGERKEYTDNRSLFTRILFGTITFPIVAVSSLITNAVDLVGTASKHTILNKNFWKNAAVVAVGVPTFTITAPPAFLLRKTIKGAYNCTVRPIIDLKDGKAINAKAVCSGVINVATFGLFGGVKKIFKGITGYTKRFGFGDNGVNDPAFLETNNRFKDAIKLTVTGNFPEVTDGQGIFRPLMRLCYRMRHTSEKVVKCFHDAYLTYCAAANRDYSMVGFFASQEYHNARRRASTDIACKPGEDTIIDAVDHYLNPQLA